MVLALVIVPLVAALVAFLVPSERVRPWIVAVTGAAHTAAAIAIVSVGIRLTNIAPWLELDALSAPSTASGICASALSGLTESSAQYFSSSSR